MLESVHSQECRLFQREVPSFGQSSSRLRGVNLAFISVFTQSSSFTFVFSQSDRLLQPSQTKREMEIGPRPQLTGVNSPSCAPPARSPSR